MNVDQVILYGEIDIGRTQMLVPTSHEQFRVCILLRPKILWWYRKSIDFTR